MPLTTSYLCQFKVCAKLLYFFHFEKINYVLNNLKIAILLICIATTRLNGPFKMYPFFFFAINSLLPIYACVCVG